MLVVWCVMWSLESVVRWLDEVVKVLCMLCVLGIDFGKMRMLSGCLLLEVV